MEGQAVGPSDVAFSSIHTLLSSSSESSLAQRLQLRGWLQDASFFICSYCSRVWAWSRGIGWVTDCSQARRRIRQSFHHLYLPCSTDSETDELLVLLCTDSTLLPLATVLRAQILHNCSCGIAVLLMDWSGPGHLHSQQSMLSPARKTCIEGIVYKRCCLFKLR